MIEAAGLSVTPAGKDGLIWAQYQVEAWHYLHAPVDPRCRPFAYLIELDSEPVGCLIFGRPESTRCYRGKLTYGSYQDVKDGRARFDRWEVLNLARVWLSPRIQKDSPDHILHAASIVIRGCLQRVGYEYLIYAPPVDCAYPYEIRCIMSYCDTRIHTGWIYLASRFKLARTNDNGIQTYMKLIPGLTDEQDARVRKMAEINKRSQRIRAQRKQDAEQLSYEWMMS